MDYTAAATVVALIRALPPTLKLADLGEMLLATGSAEQLWDAHVDGEPGPDRDAAGHDIEQWRSPGWETLTVLDPDYPDQVRAARRPPALLTAEGQLVADDHAVAIVGSRHPSHAGLTFATSLARALAELDVCVVSGLAAGVDTAAMSAAVEAGGRVVAVIGTGLDHTYPAANVELRQRILRHDGLVLSQFLPVLPEFGGAKWAFPARNRVISACSEVSVIGEASERSGTRHLAAEAVAHGRRLVLHSGVAEGTSWGRRLVGHPAVFVAARRRRRWRYWNGSPRRMSRFVRVWHRRRWGRHGDRLLSVPKRPQGQRPRKRHRVNTRRRFFMPPHESVKVREGTPAFRRERNRAGAAQHPPPRTLGGEVVRSPVW